jgi:hypothetical protein
MSWQDSRRRSRRWYKYYRLAAKKIQNLIEENDIIASEAFIRIIFDMNEDRRLHKNQRIANSAFKSMCLAIKDVRLDTKTISSKRYSSSENRPSNMAGAVRDPDEMGPSPLTSVFEPGVLVSLAQTNALPSLNPRLVYYDAPPGLKATCAACGFYGDCRLEPGPFSGNIFRCVDVTACKARRQIADQKDKTLTKEEPF